MLKDLKSRIFFSFLIACLTLPIQAASPRPVQATEGMVVSSHFLASQIGAEILKKGGNAVDAAIATGFALAVALPSAGNIGGGGFMIVRNADGTTTSFDFREKAPLAASEKMFLGPDGRYKDPINHEGYLAVGVPGTVAGFFLAHEKQGRLSMKALIEPAIRLAEDGFPVTWALSQDIQYLQKEFVKYPASAQVFLKDGKTPYAPGEIWKQNDLAKTLKRIEKEGRDGFYKGKTAQLLAAAMKMHGGLITEEDLASYQAVERSVLQGTYRDHQILSMAPPSSGGTTLLQMLNILEGYDLAQAGHNSSLYIHLLTEAMRRGFEDRARYLGDPDFNPDMPIERLTSKEYARDRRAGIDLARASKSSSDFPPDLPESEQTTHYSVIDRDGNSVVVTYTLEAGYGSKIVAEGTGFLLNNEMGDFNAEPGRTDETGLIGTPANLVAPGKRMLSSMTPTMVVKDGKPFLLIGSPGGRTIINTVLQVVLNVIDFKMDIAEAISAPRIHHQWLPDVLRIEKFGTSADTLKLLQSLGHEIEISRSSRSQGSAMGILVDPETGMISGAADPRAGDGKAVGLGTRLLSQEISDQ